MFFVFLLIFLILFINIDRRFISLRITCTCQCRLKKIYITKKNEQKKKLHIYLLYYRIFLFLRNIFPKDKQSEIELKIYATGSRIGTINCIARIHTRTNQLNSFAVAAKLSHDHQWCFTCYVPASPPCFLYSLSLNGTYRHIDTTCSLPTLLTIHSCYMNTSNA